MNTMHWLLIWAFLGCGSHRLRHYLILIQTPSLTNLTLHKLSWLLLKQKRNVNTLLPVMIIVPVLLHCFSVDGLLSCEADVFLKQLANHLFDT